MPKDAARRRFRAARVARLATVTPQVTPHMVPVTFAVLADDAVPAAEEVRATAELIVFAVDHKPKSTTALRRLDNIAANPSVAFLVDAYDEDWQRLWWVRADGTAGIIGGAVRDRALAELAAKYPQYQAVPPSGVVVGAVVTRWIGWQASGRDGEN
jgi:PPOX class probable F420-dependent enzyme